MIGIHNMMTDDQTFLLRYSWMQKPSHTNIQATSSTLLLWGCERGHSSNKLMTRLPCLGILGSKNDTNVRALSSLLLLWGAQKRPLFTFYHLDQGRSAMGNVLKHAKTYEEGLFLYWIASKEGCFYTFTHTLHSTIPRIVLIVTKQSKGAKVMGFSIREPMK
jgi:hypothetical protein